MLDKGLLFIVTSFAKEIRFGGGGRGRQNYQQQPQPPQYSAGRMGGGGYSMNVGYGGDYGQYSGAMAGQQSNSRLLFVRMSNMLLNYGWHYNFARFSVHTVRLSSLFVRFSLFAFQLKLIVMRALNDVLHISTCCRMTSVILQRDFGFFGHQCCSYCAQVWLEGTMEEQWTLAMAQWSAGKNTMTTEATAAMATSWAQVAGWPLLGREWPWFQ